LLKARFSEILMTDRSINHGYRRMPEDDRTPKLSSPILPLRGQSSSEAYALTLLNLTPFSPPRASPRRVEEDTSSWVLLWVAGINRKPARKHVSGRVQCFLNRFWKIGASPGGQAAYC
jgi:hypothetical protein